MFNFRVILSISTIMFIAIISACNEQDTVTPTEQPAAKLIAEITDVQLAVSESKPLQLTITAEGNTSSADWSNPELVPFVYVAPPQDGIYDFDFNAVPPEGNSATVITPIKATYQLNPLPDTLKGVRIHAQQNSKEAILDK